MTLSAVLSVSRRRVVLHTPGPENGTTEPPTGDWPSVDMALRRLRRVYRARHEASIDPALDRAGRALGRHFLSGPVGAALRELLAGREPVRLGIEVGELDLDDVPWETLIVPGTDLPLPKLPGISMYRTVPTGRRGSAPAPPGPIRILAVVASPTSGGPLLDYEQELLEIMNATRPRPGSTAALELEALEWGTVGGINAALATRSRHILHLTGHAGPGAFQLETEDGGAVPVDAETFVGTAIPPGAMPPFIVLAGCSTGASVTQESAGGEEHLAGLARGLIERGAHTVLAMVAPVSDRYATDLMSRLYGALAEQPGRDPLSAFDLARREAGDGSSDWWVPTLYSATEPAPLAGPGDAGTTAGPVTYRPGFVGRRAERRVLRSLLAGGAPHIAVYGLAGTGVSSLVRVAVDEWCTGGGTAVFVSAAEGPDGVMAEVAGAVGRAGHHDLAFLLRDPFLSWGQKYDIVRSQVITRIAVALCVDFTSADLDPPATDGTVRPANQDLAGLLSAWASIGSRAPLVLTGRRFVAPPGMDMAAVAVGPLSAAETMKLRRSIVALERADPATKRQMDQAGGHPGALMRIGDLVERRITGAPEAVIERLRAESGLAGLLAGMAGRRATLELAAVFGRPVPAEALGDIGLLATTGLLTEVRQAIEPTYAMHTWVASAILAETTPEARIEAHRKAAAYWRTQPVYSVGSLEQARRHLRSAGQISAALEVNEQLCKLHLEAQDWDEAERRYRQALGWVPRKSTAAAVLSRALGTVDAGRGRTAAAERRFDNALIDFRREKNDAEISETLVRIGELALRRDDSELANQCFAEARKAMEHVAGGMGVASTFRFLGQADLRRKRYLDAERLLRRALTLYERAADQLNIAGTYLDLGDVYTAQARDLEALIAYTKALDLINNHRLGPRLLVTAFGKVRPLHGDRLTAEERFDRDLELAAQQEAVGDLRGLFDTNVRLARQHQEQSEPDREYRRWVSALEVAEDLHDERLEKEIHLELAGHHRQQRRPELAAVHAIEALDRFDRVRADIEFDAPAAALSGLAHDLGDGEFSRVLHRVAPDRAERILRRVAANDRDPTRAGRAWELTAAVGRGLGALARHRLAFESLRSIRSAFAEVGRHGILLGLGSAAAVLLVAAALTRLLPDPLASFAVAIFTGAALGLASVLAMNARLRPGVLPSLLNDTVYRMTVYTLAGLWIAALIARQAGFPIVPHTLDRAIFLTLDSSWPFLHSRGGFRQGLPGTTGMLTCAAVVYAGVRGARRRVMASDAPARHEYDDDLTFLRRGGLRAMWNESSLKVLRQDTEAVSEPGELAKQLMVVARAHYANGRRDNAALALFEYVHISRTGALASLRQTIHADAQLLEDAALQVVTATHGPADGRVSELIRGHAELDPVYGYETLATFYLSRGDQRLSQRNLAAASQLFGNAVRVLDRVRESDPLHGELAFGYANLQLGRSMLLARDFAAAVEPLRAAEEVLARFGTNDGGYCSAELHEARRALNVAVGDGSHP